MSDRSDPDSLRIRLESAADGLVYSSEGDLPFRYIEVEGPAETLVGPAVELAAVLMAREPGDRVEERTLEKFFQRHIETSDPYDTRAQAVRPRYEALRSLLASSLAGVRVIRVIRASDRAVVHCYIVGRDPHGRLAGLATSAIET